MVEQEVTDKSGLEDAGEVAEDPAWEKPPEAPALDPGSEDDHADDPDEDADEGPEGTPG